MPNAPSRIGKIRTAFCSSAPVEDQWSALDDDTYDGAPDSATRGEIGYGRSEEEAIADLMRLKAERAEYREALGEQS